MARKRNLIHAVKTTSKQQREKKDTVRQKTIISVGYTMKVREGNIYQYKAIKVEVLEK